MENRDYIIHQIEQAAQVIAAVLASFLKLKVEIPVHQAIQSTHEQLKSEIDIDVEQLLLMSIKETEAHLVSRNITPELMEALSDYMLSVGRSLIDSEIEDARLYLSKALELLGIADEISKTLSFERVNKITSIQSLLDKIS